MRLATLEAELLRVLGPGVHGRGEVELAQAQGVMFLCPKCFATNGGAVGTHSIICWFRDRGVPANEPPLPGRWDVSGTSLEDLTLSPSVCLPGAGCGWHGWVKSGDAA